MAILSILFTVVIIAVSILLVLIVLIQRPKQEGLGAAFGGGALDSALGAHTTDVLQKFTTWLGILFFVSAIGLAMVKTRQFRDSAANNLLEGVEAKKAELPEGLPAALSNIPGLEGISVEPTAETPAAKTDAPKVPATPAAKTDAPKAPATPAAKADVPKAPATPAAKTDAPKAPATPAAKTDAPKAPATPAPQADAPKAPAAPAPAEGEKAKAP